MKSGRFFDEFEESPNQLGIISEPGKIALMKLQKGFLPPRSTCRCHSWFSPLLFG